MKRILAIATIVVLLGMYVVTFIAALTASPETMNIFFASATATVLLPLIVFLYLRMAEGKMQNKQKDKTKE